MKGDDEKIWRERKKGRIEIIGLKKKKGGWEKDEGEEGNIGRGKGNDEKGKMGKREEMMKMERRMEGKEIKE